jgi:ubiquinone biosynthesis protein
MGVAARFGEWVATVVRTLAIALVVLVGAIVELGGLLRRLVMRDRAARAAHRARLQGRLLRWGFARLGATFVKVGQVMSSRPDLFAPGIIDALRALQDRVPAFASARAQAIVAAAVGAPAATAFRSFDAEAVAAGSIAQVHRAVLLDGQAVAVKVVRPGVRDRIRRDARILRGLAGLAELASTRARAADAVGHVEALCAGILAQTDLRREADNYARFRREFAGTPGLAFPAVHPALSSADVLVMDFVVGVRLDEAPAAQVKPVARVLRDAFFAMCFEHGHVHADLHPGNMLVRPGGELVIIDVGLVTPLAEAVVDLVVDFARCVVIGDALDLVAHLKAHHKSVGATDWAAVAVDARGFIEALRRRSLGEIEVSVVVTRLFDLARRHKIRPLAELSLVLLGMVTIEGIAKRLDPGAHIISQIAGYLGPRVASGRKIATGSRQFPPVAEVGGDGEDHDHDHVHVSDHDHVGVPVHERDHDHGCDHDHAGDHGALRDRDRGP